MRRGVAGESAAHRAPAPRSRGRVRARRCGDRAATPARELRDRARRRRLGDRDPLQHAGPLSAPRAAAARRFAPDPDRADLGQSRRRAAARLRGILRCAARRAGSARSRGLRGAARVGTLHRAALRPPRRVRRAPGQRLPEPRRLDSRRDVTGTRAGSARRAGGAGHDTAIGPPAPPTTPPLPPPADWAAQSDALLASGRAALETGDADAAIRSFTKLLTFPEHPNTPVAKELLGVARERRNQLAHAKAEYEEFLDRYPEGEAASRVRQRLDALVTAQSKLPERRSAPGDRTRGVGTRLRSAREPLLAVPLRAPRLRVRLAGRRLVVLDRRHLRRPAAYAGVGAAQPGLRIAALPARRHGRRQRDARLVALRRRAPERRHLARHARPPVRHHRRALQPLRRTAREPPRRGALARRSPRRRARRVLPLELRVLRPLCVRRLARSRPSLRAARRDALRDPAAHRTASSTGPRSASRCAGRTNTASPRRCSTTTCTTDRSTRRCSTLTGRSTRRRASPSSPTIGTARRSRPPTRRSDRARTISPISATASPTPRSSASRRTAPRARRSSSVGGTRQLTESVQLALDFSMSNLSGTPESGGVSETEDTGWETSLYPQLIATDLLLGGDVGSIGVRWFDGTGSDTWSLILHERLPMTKAAAPASAAAPRLPHQQRQRRVRAAARRSRLVACPPWSRRRACATAPSRCAPISAPSTGSATSPSTPTAESSGPRARSATSRRTETSSPTS